MSASSIAKPSIFSPLSLRRITTSGSYIPEIDGLRFIAILSVILYHVPIQIALRSTDQEASNPFWYLISHGNRGVQLFFLISGFILGMPFAAHLLRAKKAVRLRQYFMRRLTRLEPPYILAMLFRIALLLTVMHKPLGMVLSHGAASLVYMHSLVFGDMSTVNPPAWSLEVEIQFYIMAPLLALTFFKLRPAWFRRLLGLAFIVAAGILQLYFLADQGPSRVTLSIVNYMQYFFAGFLLCDLYLTDWDRIPTHWLWDVVSIGAWCWIFEAYGPLVHVLLPVVALIAYIGAFKGLLLPRFFRLTWVSLIGGMCYSLYLTHNLAITAVDTALHHRLASPSILPWVKPLVAYAATVPAVFAVGLLLFVLVERPCMDKNWPTKLWRWLHREKKANLAVETP